MGRLVSILIVGLAFFLATSYALTQAQRDSILAKHNEYRATRGLTSLIYNTSLEAYAQSWINNCNFQHSNGPYGENLWGSYGTQEPSDVATAVVSWQGEEEYWSCQNNQCNPPSGSSCGHFTQVMWDSSTEVGCAMVSGCKPDTSDVHVIIMCNYDPPGNFVGDRPYSLTKCPNYPYFSDSEFVLDIVLNTTSFSESAFKTSLNSALGLQDTDRIVIIHNESAGTNLVKVQLYIVTVGSSNGKSEADKLIQLVESKSTTLTSRGIYATEASYSSGGSASSLSSWIIDAKGFW